MLALASPNRNTRARSTLVNLGRHKQMLARAAPKAPTPERKKTRSAIGCGGSQVLGARKRAKSVLRTRRCLTAFGKTSTNKLPSKEGKPDAR